MSDFTAPQCELPLGRGIRFENTRRDQGLHSRYFSFFRNADSPRRDEGLPHKRKGSLSAPSRFCRIRAAQLPRDPPRPRVTSCPPPPFGPCGLGVPPRSGPCLPPLGAASFLGRFWLRSLRSRPSLDFFFSAARASRSSFSGRSTSSMMPTS